jgi:arylsulfatase A-like enzyme
VRGNLEMMKELLTAREDMTQESHTALNRSALKVRCWIHPIVEGSDYYPKCTQQQERPDTVCRVVMQRYKNWKLIIRTNNQNELYHMNEDPWEVNNLYGQEKYKEIQETLTKKMLNWLIHTSDVEPVEGRYI